MSENEKRVRVPGTGRIRVDESSIISTQPESELGELGADLVFRLEVAPFEGEHSQLRHHLVLVALEVGRVLKEAEVSVPTVTDLGVLSFSRSYLKPDDDVVRREVGGCDHFIGRGPLARLWQRLVGEIRRYEREELGFPIVRNKRYVTVAVFGMSYFNGFAGPALQKMPDVYHSLSREVVRDAADEGGVDGLPGEPLLLSN